MKRLKVWLWSWLQQLLLRRRPQDDVLSYSALTGGLMAYLLIDLLQALGHWSVYEAIAVSVLDLLVMVLFTGVVLAVTRNSARLVQTLTALAGTGAVLGAISLPLFFQAATQAAPPNAVVVLGWLLVFGWHIVVQAHIFRHALTLPFGGGLAVVLVYTVLVMALLERLFPHTGETGGF